MDVWSVCRASITLSDVLYEVCDWLHTERERHSSKSGHATSRHVCTRNTGGFHVPPGGPGPYRDRMQQPPCAGGARERTTATLASFWPASAVRVPRGAFGRSVTPRREERLHTRFCALETRCPPRRSESPRQMSPACRFRVVRSDTSCDTAGVDGRVTCVCVHG